MRRRESAGLALGLAYSFMVRTPPPPMKTGTCAMNGSCPPLRPPQRGGYVRQLRLTPPGTAACPRGCDPAATPAPAALPRDAGAAHRVTGGSWSWVEGKGRVVCQSGDRSARADPLGGARACGCKALGAGGESVGISAQEPMMGPNLAHARGGSVGINKGGLHGWKQGKRRGGIADRACGWKKTALMHFLSHSPIVSTADIQPATAALRQENY